MEAISKSVTKKDHAAKMSGQALYVDDHCMEDMLCGKLLRSGKAKARLIDIRLPVLPDGYYIVDKNDVSGQNRVHIVQDDTPVFAGETVEYIGDPILMLAGPDPLEVERLLGEIHVVYQEEVPILDIEKSDTVFFHYHYEKGNWDKALKEADHVFSQTYETGYQEQAYLEPQGMIAIPGNGRMTVRGSMQCPYYVHGAVAAALGYDKDRVRIIQDVTGGGFGGKEAFPSILACQVAVAAAKTGKPVKAVFDRREDMEFTSKRHPSRCRYTVAVKNNRVTGMDIDVKFNSGAFTTLSPVVLQRGIICACGVYDIPCLRVNGRAFKTNTVPTGAYRGFGAPQTFFAVECMMNHVARQLGEPGLAFKEKHMVKQGDATSTGGRYHFPVPLPEMISRADRLSGYREKKEKYRKQTGRYRKGIGISLAFHGCGFTGTGERDIIKAVARLKKNADGTVEVLASNTDIGQGLKTTFCKIVADTLDIPLAQVLIENPDTDIVPDSGPTVASRSLMTVGYLLMKAAARLKKEWKDGAGQIIEERYKEPEFMIPFNMSAFHGDAYPSYSWAVSVVELEIDTLTAVHQVTGAWGIFDVGVPIDMNIIQGQMQGGFLQGIGYSSMEQMNTNAAGRIRNNSYSDYIIPTSVDVPLLATDIVNNPYPHGPYGAKGAGELPLVGVAPAYLEAVENALGDISLCKAPFTAEDTMTVLSEVLA